MTKHDIFSTLAILGTGAALAGCATIQADAAEVRGPQRAAHGEGSCSAAGCGGKAKTPAATTEVAQVDAGTVEAPTASEGEGEVEADANAEIVASDEEISADAAPAATEVTAIAGEDSSGEQATLQEEVEEAAAPPPKKNAPKKRRAKKKKRASAGEAACGEGTCA